MKTGPAPAGFANSRIGWETMFLAVIVALTFVPFLAENLFTTKGEPREAVVALSMLQQDNWILPVSFGTDIPYKPPFLAWCIALLGLCNGGVVTEALSRLPSALAAVVMIVAGFRLVAHRHSIFVASAMALITAGTFEVFRSATVCRVDMLLTMFTVTGLYAFYRQWNRHEDGTWRPSLLAAAMMTGAVLTKGPVGMLLPCAVALVFRLMRGNPFWQTFVSVGVTGLMSLVLPALWYVAAYRQGGESFLQLAMEENFGRFTGSMGYSSHEHSVWYNFTSLLSGYAPYTLLLLISLAGAPWKHAGGRRGAGWRERLRGMDSMELFSWLAFIIIFVFYCIPKSKRSVYLLPIYPFIGYLVAVYLDRLLRWAPKAVKAYCWVICVVGALASIAVACAMWLPEGLIDLGEKNAPVLEALRRAGRGVMAPVAVALMFVGACLLGERTVRKRARTAVMWTAVYTLVIYMCVQAAVLPAAMNFKSDLVEARILERRVPAGATLYSYRAEPMSRFFTVNFYLGDRMRVFDAENPDSGYLLLSQYEEPDFIAGNSDRWDFRKVLVINKRGGESKCPTVLYRFERR